MAYLTALLPLAWLAVAVNGRRLADSQSSAAYAEASNAASADAGFSPKPFLLGALARSPMGLESPGAIAKAPGAVHHGRVSTELAMLRRAPGPARTDDEIKPRRPGFISRIRGLFPKAGDSLVGLWARWELIAVQQIGRGYKGNVWKARMTTDKVALKLVAVKIERLMSSIRPDPRTRAQGLREAAIMERFSGGRFLEYYGYWERRDCFLHIMELADGAMQEMVIEQPFEVVDIPTRVRLFTELVGGLAEMHAAGYVHRSVWPKNVLVKRENDQLHVKLSDFAVACSFKEDAGPEALTPEERTKLVGVPAYLAPEIWDSADRAEAGWGPKTDAFAAGVLLYQMLFEGNYPPLVSAIEDEVDMRSPMFRDAWRKYDPKKDTLLQTAKAAAEPSDSDGGDLWFAQVLGILEQLLDRDVGKRMDAIAAYKALSDIDWQEPRSRAVLSKAMLARN